MDARTLHLTCVRSMRRRVAEVMARRPICPPARSQLDGQGDATNAAVWLKKKLSTLEFDSCWVADAEAAISGLQSFLGLNLLGGAAHFIDDPLSIASRDLSQLSHCVIYTTPSHLDQLELKQRACAPCNDCAALLQTA